MNHLVYKKIFTKPNLIASIHFIGTFFNDLIIYKLQNSLEPSNRTLFYWGGKFIVFILLLEIWNLIFKIDIKEKECQKYIKACLIIFVPMIVLEILVWPGIWRWDEMITLGNLTNGYVYYWQHWLSSLYQFICMQLIPCPAGIVIIQIALISLIVGSIIYRLMNYLNTKLVYILYFPLFLPAIVDSNLYPIRATLCAYIELWVMFQIIFISILNEKYTIRKMGILAGLCGLMISWRPENVIYLIGIPLILLFTKKCSQRRVSMFLILIILIAGCCSKIQNYGLSKGIFLYHEDGSVIREKEAYPLSGIITSLGDIVNSNFRSNTKEKDLENINKAIDLEILRESGGMGAFWNGGLKDLTSENLKKIENIYVKLVVCNFPVFLSKRIELFLQTNIVPDTQTLLEASSHIYDEANDILSENVIFTYNEFRNRYIYNRPLNNSIRKTIISFLECKKTTDYYASSTGWTIVFYNVIPILVVLIGILIIELIRKNRIYVLLVGTLLTKVIAIILTAPMPFFMYYFSTYLVGLFIIIFWGINERNTIKNIKSRLKVRRK